MIVYHFTFINGSCVKDQWLCSMYKSIMIYFSTTNHYQSVTAQATLLLDFPCTPSRYINSNNFGTIEVVFRIEE